MDGGGDGGGGEGAGDRTLAYMAALFFFQILITKICQKHFVLVWDTWEKGRPLELSVNEGRFEEAITTNPYWVRTRAGVVVEGLVPVPKGTACNSSEDQFFV